MNYYLSEICNFRGGIHKKSLMIAVGAIKTIHTSRDERNKDMINEPPPLPLSLRNKCKCKIEFMNCEKNGFEDYKHRSLKRTDTQTLQFL